MARPTRQQRRARRDAHNQSALAEQGRIAREARSLQSQKVQPSRKQESTRRGPFSFVRESWGELKKVDWPGRQQVVQGTVVVLLACAIVGGYLFIADLALKRFVSKVLLGQ
ncbi:MAG: preprotein translocase subunit SecE [Gaiellaceae bacterium]|jgi:preprotein translocase subunit SecE